MLQSHFNYVGLCTCRPLKLVIKNSFSYDVLLKVSLRDPTSAFQLHVSLLVYVARYCKSPAVFLFFPFLHPIPLRACLTMVSPSILRSVHFLAHMILLLHVCAFAHILIGPTSFAYCVCPVCCQGLCECIGCLRSNALKEVQGTPPVCVG